MNKKQEIRWYEQENSLNEIYQQTGMVFSFVSSPKNGLRQCHQWVKCRDYLHDVIRACHTGKSFKVYGFFYNPEDNPQADLEKIRMLVSKNALDKTNLTAFRSSMKASLALLNHYEKMMGVGLSKIKEMDGGEKEYAWIFTGPKAWLKSPHLVSMYTFLIRLGSKKVEFKDNKDLRAKLKKLSNSRTPDNDTNYLQRMWNHLDWVAKNYKKYLLGKDGLDDMYGDNNITIDNFHNYGGIKSLIDCCSPLPERNEKMEKLLKKDK